MDRPPVARNVAKVAARLYRQTPLDRTPECLRRGFVFPTAALSGGLPGEGDRNGKMVASPPVFRKDSKEMKAGIHPAYDEVNVICACGSTFRTRSTHKGDLRVEICSSCHPFFTGRQKLVDTEGRVDRFRKKAAKAQEMQAQKKAAADAKSAKKVH